MNTIKVLVVTTMSAFRHQAATLLWQLLNVQAVFCERSEQIAEMLCQHRPSLILVDTQCSGKNTSQMAQTVWSVEPTVQMLFCLPKEHAFLAKSLKNSVPLQSTAGFILHSSTSEKMMLALQSLLSFSNSYFDPALRPSKEPHQAQTTLQLTPAERETLGDLLLGLTDKAIARKRNMTVRGVQSRLERLAKKLLGTEREQSESLSGIEFYNARARMIFQALKRGIFSVEDIVAMEAAS